MTTFNELAKQYAQRIKIALAKDGFSKFSRITASVLRCSATIQESKSVKQDIEGLVYIETKEPLTKTDKQGIIIEIHKELYVPLQRPRPIRLILEEASDDDLFDIAGEIANILKGRD